METFRLLFLRGSLLERAEEVRATNVVEAVSGVFGKPPEMCVEVWSEKGRVGIIGQGRH